MLYEATALEEINLGFKNFNQADMDACLYEWNINTPSELKFIKAAGANYSIGDNGIKSTWTVVEA
jgi:hypothetical protein